MRSPGAAQGFHLDPLTEHSVQTLLNVIEVRRGMEAETAALAAARRTPRRLAEIKQALGKSPKLSRPGPTAWRKTCTST